MPPRDARPAGTGARPARRRVRAGVGTALVAAAAAHAQTPEGSTASGVVLTPTFSAIQTLTDNRNLSSTNRQADAITQITPGVRIDARNSQLTGGLNLGVNALYYARQSQSNSVSLQTSLDSAFRWQALDRRVFVDATATASQQAISAFGRQSAGTTLVDDGNRSQVTTVTVMPGFRGRIADWAEVEARLNAAKTDTGSTALGDSSTYGGQVSVDGRAGLFGWGLTANDQVSDYKAGRQTTTSQVIASLSYAPRYDWRFTGRVGRTRSDAIAQQAVWVQTNGGTVNWQPTDRTDVTLQRDRTYYGRSYLYSLRHRMERTVWSYTDSAGIPGEPGFGSNGATGANGSTQVAVPLTIYDLLYANCLRSGGATAACEQSVRAFLASQGVSPTLPVGSGFLSAGLTLQRSRNLSVAWSLQRQTVGVNLFRNSTTPLDRSNVQGDLALVDRVRQEGLTFSASHQLTPTATLVATLTLQKTLDAGSQQGNTQKMATIGWNGQLTDRSNASVTFRHIDFTSATSPYQESAVLGSLSMRF